MNNIVKTVRVIFIDSDNSQISRLSLDTKTETITDQINKMVGGYFTEVKISDTETLYLNEESTLQKHAFAFSHQASRFNIFPKATRRCFFGNWIILQIDKDGNNMDTEFSLNEAKEFVEFIY